MDISPCLGPITECTRVITVGLPDLANKNTGHPVKFALDLFILKMNYCLDEIQVYLSGLYLSGNATPHPPGFPPPLPTHCLLQSPFSSPLCPRAHAHHHHQQHHSVGKSNKETDVRFSPFRTLPGGFFADDIVN